MKHAQPLLGLQEELGMAAEGQHSLWQVEANTTLVQEQHQLLTGDPILLACKHSLHH